MAIDYLSIEWLGDKVKILDQTRLPQEEVYLELDDYRDIALAITGGAFILSASVLYGQRQLIKQKENQSTQLIAKLEEIKQELKKEDNQKGKGIAIADMISSGLRYYSEHLTGPKKEDKND